MFSYKKSDQHRTRRLRASLGLYDAGYRFEWSIHINVMLRRLAQLQKVAENDHFWCEADPAGRIRSQDEMLDIFYKVEPHSKY